MSSKDPIGNLMKDARGLSDDAFARVNEAARRKAEREFVSIKDLAAELDVSVRTLRRWNRRPDAPPRVKWGRRLMYRRADIQHWFEAIRG